MHIVKDVTYWSHLDEHTGLITGLSRSSWMLSYNITSVSPLKIDRSIESGISAHGGSTENPFTFVHPDLRPVNLRVNLSFL